MDIVRLSISRPVGVTVAVLLVVMFGLIGLTQIPIQLTPTVDRPIITVQTTWPGRSPQEVVDQITIEQEDRLKNVANLRSMRSVSSEGRSEITLEFTIGSDISRALQEVADALRQVSTYPEEVNEPTIRASEGAAENAIAWIMLEVDPDHAHRFPDFDITTLFYPMDDEVKPYLERIDGVAEVNVYGGRDREVRILLDPTALAQRGLNHAHILEALRGENRNISAGTIAEGKRDYRVRVLGQFTDPEQILDTVVAYRDGRPVYVRDVGTVEIGHQKQRGFVRSLGQPVLAMNVIRQSGANVVDVMEELRLRLDEVRAGVLPNLHPEVGPHLRLRQVYDETTYIDSAIQLVQQNLWVGGTLAVFVLILFLRSFVSTGVVAVAIPVSVIGTFLILLALGRSLNVVSLAGLVFAVGMVVDNAIVVLENIYRRLQQGDPPIKAAYAGGREVWGAILASTLTTMAVFVPVLTIQEEAGQLFRDIAIAIVSAVALSLCISITVIPAASSRWLRQRRPETHGRVRTAWEDLFGLATLLARGVERFRNTIRWAITGWRGWTVRPALILFMTAASLLGAWALMPPLDYLPAGNRNLVFGGLLIPPGLSVEQQSQIAQRIEDQLRPYVQADADEPASMADLPPTFRFDAPEDPFDPVPIQNFFIGAFAGNMFIGGTSQKEQVVIPIGALLTNVMNTIPDAFGGARQTSIFGRGAGGGNTINLEISGNRLADVNRAANFMFNRAAERFTHGNVRPDPSNFNLFQPEWRIALNDRGRELGLTTAALGAAARALFDGAFVGDFQLNGKPVDLVLLPSGGRLEYKERLASIPVATPAGPVVPLDTVVNLTAAGAPQQIQRIEGRASVTLRITPPDGRPLEDVMRQVRAEIIAPAREAGLIDPTMRIRLEGVAAQLDEVKAALFGAGAPAAAGPDQPARPGGVAGRLLRALGFTLLIAGLAASALVLIRGLRRAAALGSRRPAAYAAAGALLMAIVVGAVLLVAGNNPQLLTARFVWALVVTYLLMCALFESFTYPFVIMFTVPLAIVGGFAGLRIVHDMSEANPVIAPQNLDVLTMLGFIILIGVVVNNAILLVHQSLNFMRGAHGNEPLAPPDAIAQAVRTRVRPILMSTLTSIGGMLPLVLFPGAGSEMYRGLGSVVIGGLLVSSFFTLILVPLLFSLMVEMSASLRSVLAGHPRPPEGVEPPTSPTRTRPEPAQTDTLQPA